jgi:uncharacterized protein
VELLTAVPLGFALGFLIGLTGVGGGALVAPALYVILGLPYGEAVALSLLYSVFTKIVSAVQHMRQRSVLWKITMVYGLAGIPGAVVGSRVIYWTTETTPQAFPLLMSGILLLVSALMLMESFVKALAAREKPFSPHELPGPVMVGIVVFQFAVGVVLGLTSVGSGSLVVLSMLFFFRMSAQEIVGSNIVIALIMAVPAGFTHYAAGGVNSRLLLLLLAGSSVGAVLGSRATLRVPERELKLAIVVLLVAGAVATIVRARL